MTSTRLTSRGEERIIEAIREAESRTSGEIRVHVARRCKGDPLEAARRCFARLGMTSTAGRNGVLFFVAERDRKFAVVGDEGIHRTVGESFWTGLRDRMSEQFRAGRIEAGLIEAILDVGEQLSRSFPRREIDVDELPDVLSRDEPL